MVHHSLKCRRSHSFGAREVVDQARVQIARTGAHDEPCCRREAHAGVDALAVAHGCQACAAAEVREDHGAFRSRRVDAAELLHQVGERQAVEAVSHDAFCGVPSGDRQQPGDSWHRVVKGGVEAGHLGQLRMPMGDCFDEANLARQMIRVVRRDAAEFREQLAGDSLGRGMRHAVNDAVSHGADGREDLLAVEPIQQGVNRRTVVASSNAIDLPIEESPRRVAGREYGEPDTRRAAVNRQHRGSLSVHAGSPRAASEEVNPKIAVTMALWCALPHREACVRHGSSLPRRVRARSREQDRSRTRDEPRHWW